MKKTLLIFLVVILSASCSTNVRDVVYHTTGVYLAKNDPEAKKLKEEKLRKIKEKYLNTNYIYSSSYPGTNNTSFSSGAGNWNVTYSKDFSRIPYIDTFMASGAKAQYGKYLYNRKDVVSPEIIPGIKLGANYFDEDLFGKYGVVRLTPTVSAYFDGSKKILELDDFSFLRINSEGGQVFSTYNSPGVLFDQHWDDSFLFELHKSDWPEITKYLSSKEVERIDNKIRMLVDSLHKTNDSNGIPLLQKTTIARGGIDKSKLIEPIPISGYSINFDHRGNISGLHLMAIYHYSPNFPELFKEETDSWLKSFGVIQSTDVVYSKDHVSYSAAVGRHSPYEVTLACNKFDKRCIAEYRQVGHVNWGELRADVWAMKDGSGRRVKDIVRQDILQK
ncbi:hypothetical protein [Teredinibacter turnerae]|uniref:hypothetical protein n=1 Tax=Teredinibacter turnerae TaxID=2426 RepID=UPI00040BB1CA|nr:hypothetical protein [Teredinibacter turnerae]